MTALDRLAERTAAYEATLALAKTQRAEVIEAVLDAFREGEEPKAVVANSPWTARQIRGIREDAKLPQARAGKKPKTKPAPPSE